jgi:thioredoxin reductase (NADPH)
MTESQRDLVIVGGGPAGVSAALECTDIKLDVVLLEARAALGGQLPEITHPVRNVATGRYSDGTALQASLQDAAGVLAERARLEHPVTVAALAGGWVEARGERFSARAVLIASGTTAERLPAAPDGAFGGDVTYEIESDPDRFTGKTVVVIGGGDSASLDALALAPTASSVLLAHRAPQLTARQDIVAQLRAEKKIEDLPSWELVSLHGHEHLEEVVLSHQATGEQRTVKAGGVVVKISRDPATGPFHGQIDLDHRGFVVVDQELRTSCPGVFAAGDVVSGAYWRVSSALGQGSLVSRAVLNFLQESR